MRRSAPSRVRPRLCTQACSAAQAQPSTTTRRVATPGPESALSRPWSAPSLRRGTLASGPALRRAWSTDGDDQPKLDMARLHGGCGRRGVRREAGGRGVSGAPHAQTPSRSQQTTRPPIGRSRGAPVCRGSPLGPRGEPAPLACRREATVALECRPRVGYLTSLPL